ncbi:MAG: hypothetical protein WDA07_04165 [Leucobacter sp.]
MVHDSTAEGARLARLLFPELANQLDAALARNVTHDATAEFDAWLDAEAAERLSVAEFDGIEDSEVADRLARAFETARVVAGKLKVRLPETAEFIGAGMDLESMSHALTNDPTLEPVPTPHGLGHRVWEEAFAPVPTYQIGSAERKTASADTLILASEAVREFPRLDTAPSTVTVHSDGCAWTVRLIPAAQKPPLLGLGFVHGSHPTLPEMLMLQLMLRERGSDPVDPASFTWLAGPLADGRLAARHVFDESERAVRITCREIGSQGPHLGARPPV